MVRFVAHFAKSCTVLAIHHENACIRRSDPLSLHCTYSGHSCSTNHELEPLEAQTAAVGSVTAMEVASNSLIWMQPSD